MIHSPHIRITPYNCKSNIVRDTTDGGDYPLRFLSVYVPSPEFEQEALLDASQRLETPSRLCFDSNLDSNLYLMDRQAFVNAFVECLKNNGNIVSAGDTAEGTYYHEFAG